MLFYLVDDDPASIDILRIIIEDSDLGDVIGSAASGTEALEGLRHMRPDIVITDLLMPDMDGIEFVRQARDRFPGVRFLMLSQVTAKDMVAEAYHAGVDFFITKPINSVEVVKEDFEKTATHKIRRFKYQDAHGDEPQQPEKNEKE